MGKGMLKQRLAVALATEDIKKSEQKKQLKQKEASKDDGPKVVTKEQLAAREAAKEAKKQAKIAQKVQEAEDAAAAEQKAKDEYESTTLSKKEQRKLKKALLAKAQQESKENQEEESLDEEDADSEEDDVEIAEDEDSEMEEYLLDLEKLARSDSEDDDEEEDEENEEEQDGEEIIENADEGEEEEEEEDDDEEEDEDIPLSDVELDSDADVVPHTKLTINNVAALKDALARIQLPWNKHSFQEHQTITSAEKCESQIKDIYDDTERELAFYKQALYSSTEGRSKLLKLKVAFTRPADYFAEMIKSDEHMEKLKNKLVKEATEKKASEEAKRQRQLKKFGKQVQNATLQDRQKEKRDTLEKIKGIKRKRQDNEMTNDEFDIAIEEATADKAERAERETRGRGHTSNNRAKPNNKRLAKDSKYGQGGMKRFKRKNDAASSNDMTDFSQRKMKGKSARPGKSKRTRR